MPTPVLLLEYLTLFHHQPNSSKILYKIIRFDKALSVVGHVVCQMCFLRIWSWSTNKLPIKSKQYRISASWVKPFINGKTKLDLNIGCVKLTTENTSLELMIANLHNHKESYLFVWKQLLSYIIKDQHIIGARHYTMEWFICLLEVHIYLYCLSFPFQVWSVGFSDRSRADRLLNHQCAFV